MLSNEQIEAVQAYVNDVAAVFGLRDWEVKVRPGDPPDGAYASCSPVYGSRFANLRFSEEWLTASPNTKRETVIHELLHCHMSGTTHFMQTDVEKAGLLSAQAHSLLLESFRQHIENGIDAIAVAIAAHFPDVPELPPSPEVTSNG